MSMNKVQLHLLSFFFAAFLPPKNDSGTSDGDYYSRLDVKKSASSEEIRKAYKKKSLQFHPDKIAQFSSSNGKSVEEVQADFVKIKEAYEVLSNANKRATYDVMGESGAKMMSNPSDALNPQTLLHNLSRASYWNKTKLFLIVIIVVGMILAGPILICAKVDQVLSRKDGSLADTKWVVILIPIWFLNGLLVSLMIIGRALFPTIKMVCVIVTEVFLALKWDGNLKWCYLYILVPLYLHQFVAVIECLSWIRQARRDLTKMVTLTYLEKEILPEIEFPTSCRGNQAQNIEAGSKKRFYTDLNDEERDYINKNYIIIQESPTTSDECEYTDEDFDMIDEETKLLIAIATSTECQQLMMIRSHAYSKLRSILLMHVAFLVLLVLKLDGNKDWNWFLVFVPIWVEIGLATLWNCYACCFTGSVASPEANTEKMPTEKKEVYSEDDNISAEDVENAGITLRTFSGDDTNLKSEMDLSQVSSVGDLNDNYKEEPGTAYADVSPLYAKEDMKSPITSLPMTSQASDDNRHSSTKMKTHIEDDQNQPEQDDTKSRNGERQSKALSLCCAQILISVFLALFLVQLNGAENSTGSREIFSAFWVAFPIFFISGLILCCCCCFIYQSTSLESRMENETTDDENKDGNPFNLDVTSEENIGVFAVNVDETNQSASILKVTEKNLANEDLSYDLD